MRLLDRYFLRELLFPLGFCLGGFLVFWVAFDMFAQLPDFLKAKMKLADIAEYYLVSAPEMLVTILPVALLLALLYALTHHAKYNEITAVRAAGVGLWRLAAPYLAVGLALSMSLFVLNEMVVPSASGRADEIKKRGLRPKGAPAETGLARNLGFINAREGRDWLVGSFNLSSGEMQQLRVRWMLPEGTACLLYADRGVFTNGAWAFFGVREFRRSPEQESAWVPTLLTNYLYSHAFNENPDEVRSEVRVSPGLSLKQAKKADIPLADLLSYIRFHPRLPAQDYAWVHTKMQGRLASPWTCMVVVLIAIPFGAPSGRRNVFVGVAGSIFICFAYFGLQQLGLTLGSGNVLPPWLGAWLPNLLFGSAAIYFIFRVR